MKKETRMPRPLERKFGFKISCWLNNFLTLMEQQEDFQENLFEMINIVEHSCFGEEQEAFLKKILSECLTLSFVVNKHWEEIESLSEDYGQGG